MSRYEELEKTIKDAQAEIEKLKAEEQEAARKAWVPEEGERVLWLDSGGLLVATAWGDHPLYNLHHYFAHGRIAPDNERGRTWLEAIAAWERALKESYDERAKGEDGGWWYWSVKDVTSMYSPSSVFPIAVMRRTKEEAEADGERWGKRLAQGRGF